MSKIEWTDRTLNCFVGCRRVSQGCRHCYAEGQVHRKLSPQHRGLTVVGKQGVRWNGEVNYAPHRFDEMLRARKPQRWFINSLSDLFFEPVPFETIAALLGMMAVAHAWHGHTAQILTKRVERAKAFFDWLDAQYPDPRATMQVCMGWFVGGAPEQLRVQSSAWKRAVSAVMGVEDPFPFWLGVSVEDQPTADVRLPILRRLPAAVRCASYEPALGGVDWRRIRRSFRDGTREHTFDALAPTFGAGLDWIIVGGESGHGARPFDVQWARDTIEQARRAGVPVFVKQLGAHVLTRNDDNFTIDGEPDWWPDWLGEAGRVQELPHGGYQGAPVRVRLTHPKGGDPAEWPEELRVREFPCAGGQA